MDSKTLTTIVIVIICVMLFPIAIGIIGGIFGVIGGVIGGIFGVVAGIFGAIFGVIGAIFGGIFGWADYDYWGCSFNFFDKDIFMAIALIIVIVLIARARNSRPTPRQ